MADKLIAELRELRAFLAGSGSLEDAWFGDTKYQRNINRHVAFWWRKHLGRIDRALQALEGAWRPIETAPKDGTVFLGWKPLWDFPQPVCWERPNCDDGSHPGAPGVWVYADWAMHALDDDGIEPILWMPLYNPLPDQQLEGSRARDDLKTEAEGGGG